MKMSKEMLLPAIEQAGLIAVVRGEDESAALQTACTCIKYGVRVIELTFTVPFAHHVLEALAKTYGDRNIIGAGTVLDPYTARIAMLSGAQFIVSPHFDPEIAVICNRYRCPYFAGVMTVTEAIAAMDAGVDILKLFPGSAFGPSFIKALHGPLPQARIMPTGGVSLNNVADWIKSGAVAIGVGSDLTKGDPAVKIQQYLAAIRDARANHADRA